VADGRDRDPDGQRRNGARRGEDTPVAQEGKNLLAVSAGGGHSVPSIVNQTAGIWPDPIRHLRLIFAKLACITAGLQTHAEQRLRKVLQLQRHAKMFGEHHRSGTEQARILVEFRVEHLDAVG